MDADGGPTPKGTESHAEEVIDDCPIEEVRLTVPPTDKPSQPVLTFRTWTLGLSACVILSFVNQFFGYRQNQLYVGSVSVQIAVLPLGKLMAATLPTAPIKVPFTPWSFSLNPGPFNMKEHVLITIFANAGSSGVYALNIVTIVMAFYHRKMNPVAAMLLTQTTQLLGYGWAGIFRKILVDSPYMWWPSKLVDVSLFRALHEEDKRVKGRLTRLQFFLVVMAASFAYYLLPGYFFQAISNFSFVCWIWKDSVLAQQLGAGRTGLGLGSFGLDWAAVSYLGSPLATPGFAIANIMVGFFLVIYVVLPLCYWNNVYDARKFPIISAHTFDASGKKYNVSTVLDRKTFDFIQSGYDSLGKLHMSISFALNYGLSFATLTAALSHVFLFYGKSIWKQFKATMETAGAGDVHTRMMKKNYKAVPQWWFHVILVSMVLLSIYTCEGFGGQLQLPWWGVLMACALAFVFTLPIGVIVATTNQAPGLNVITEMIIGYILPGKVLANVAFKTYGYISMAQALTFLQDFKLGHYMKIPPRSMFVVQLVGTVVASTTYFATSWWLLTTVPNICDTDLLPEDSPWTCPGDDVFYNASIIWGLIGPLRMFGRLGNYMALNWFFLLGLLAPVPVWLLSRRFPDKHWIPLINMPVILSASGGIPPAGPVNYYMWGAVGVIFNVIIYRKYKDWWAKHTYVLSAGLDAGVAFMGILLFFALGMNGINGLDWWGADVSDHCPLAKCPTAPGIKVGHCPVF